MEAQPDVGADARTLAIFWLGGSLAVWAVIVLVTGALTFSGQIRQAEDAFIAETGAIRRQLELALNANEQVLSALVAFVQAGGENRNLADLQRYAQRLLDGHPHIHRAALLLSAGQDALPELVPLVGGQAAAMNPQAVATLRKAAAAAKRREGAVAVGLQGRFGDEDAYLLLQPLQLPETAQLWLLLEVTVAALLPAVDELPLGMTMMFHPIGATETAWLRSRERPGATGTSLFPALHFSTVIGEGGQALVLNSYRRLDWSVIRPTVATAFLLAAAAGLVMALRYGRSRIHRERARRTAELRLYRLANYDSLTGLPNRNLFKERLQCALLRARRNALGVALCFVDLDGFKAVNDSAGHDAGDRLLQLVGQRLSTVVRVQDTVARLSGDEFVVVLEGLSGRIDAERVIGELRDCFIEPFEVGDYQFALTASIGVAVFPEDGDDPVQLLRRADARMYASKHSEWVAAAAPAWPGTTLAQAVDPELTG
jgi:diguanylate cyclase (GGDEF)-like protein